jgi:hypothetical protein
MARFGHFDVAATKQAFREGRFLDKRSRLLRRLDGSYRVELRGIDASNLRRECFERDRGLCVDRSDGRCSGPLEMSHWPPMSKSEGSDELDKVSLRCKSHHIRKDYHDCPAHF